MMMQNALTGQRETAYRSQTQEIASQISRECNQTLRPEGITAINLSSLSFVLNKPNFTGIVESEHPVIGIYFCNHL
jgi:hypothetical protein